MVKHFKTILIAGISAIIGLVSCTTETDFNDRLTNLEERVSKLEKLCAEMNTNISSLQGIVSALQNQDYITAVNELTSDGKVIGYTINFAKGQPITIYHGKDGVNGKDGADGKDGTDGKDGQNGKDGKDGADGKDGSTPVIGVKQDTDGIWYWTLNGEWLLDDNGQKIKAVGTDGKDGQNGKDGQDGKDGQNGQDGKDGITPQLKIEEGYWYVSTDNGQTWTQLGKATGENGKDGVDGKDGKDGVDGVDGDSMFQSVTVTETEVTFVTSDGQTFVLKRASALSIEFDTADLVVMGTNSTRNIHYTITSGVDNITIEALSSADIKVKVVKTDAKTGTLQVKTGATIDEYSKVVVLVNNGSQAIMRTLTFEEQVIRVEENTTKAITKEGGEVDLEFFSNVPCHAVIPVEAQSWISVAPETKALTKQTIWLIVQPNTGAARSATVVLQSEDGSLVLPFLIEQGTSEEAPTASVLYTFLPDDIGKENISSIVFHVLDDTITDYQLSASLPVYYDKVGTTVNIYTSAALFDISLVTPLMFYQYSSLKSLDLSMTIVPTCASFFRTFCECVSLESIVFGDWKTNNVTSTEMMFMRCEKLRSLDLTFMDTSNVENMENMFWQCYSLPSLNLSSFNTSKVTNMRSMFNSCSLTSLDLHSFDTKKVTDMSGMFCGCTVLQTLDLSGFNTSNVTEMSGLFADCQNLKQLNISSFNTSNVESFNTMFYGCSSIENLDLSHFVTSKVQNMYFMFGWCTSLKNLDISSFTSESLQTAELMFGTCQKLQKLNLGAFDISGANCQSIGQAIMRTSKSGAIRCIPETKAALEPTMDDSLSGKVEWMTLSDDISTYEYHRNPNLYYSSDFSKHETVRKLYSATKGKGIDIVLMGDVYSDRMIASGQYDEDMELAVDAIFSQEPMASYKDCFNIYIVYLVSDNEVIGESTALDAVKDGYNGYYASAVVPDKYRKMATGNGDLKVQEAIVIINDTDHVSGYANMEGWDFDVPYFDCDYGRGKSSIVVGRGNRNDSVEFQSTIVHEFGHSFAKLADEYVTYDSEAGEGQSYEIITSFTRFGWWKNVDVTSDPATIRWSRFLSDERYANEKLGAYEGGFEYSRGIWRPTEESIMKNHLWRHGFNAPSREAIYNRIHKLAYGDDWQFDYETFVQQDLKNIPDEPYFQASPKYTLQKSRVDQKHIFKMEKSIAPDGRQLITIIQD